MGRDPFATHSRPIRESFANWSKHQRVDKPNRKAALSEVVEVVDDTAFQESFANQSRIIRESFATDLRPRPTTYDQDLKGTARAAARARAARETARLPPPPGDPGPWGPLAGGGRRARRERGRVAAG